MTVHLRHITDYAYSLDSFSLKVESDLGVLVHYDLKSGPNCSGNPLRANLAHVTMRSSFGQLDGRTSHLILDGFIWPHLEHGNIVSHFHLETIKILWTLSEGKPRNKFGDSDSDFMKSLSSHWNFTHCSMACSILSTPRLLKYLLKLSPKNTLWITPRN